MIADYINPRLILDTSDHPQGSVTWRSPSNLAIIKYWGKYGRQLPRNPSISMTLQAAHTTTTMHYRRRQMTASDGISLELFFAGQPAPAFAERIQRYLVSITDIYPFLRQLHLTIHTDNSFPHSSGIASSASAMSALALCLCSLERHFFDTLPEKGDFLSKASYLARLASGSASRSVYPFMAAWGRHGDVPGSSDEYAVPFGDQIHAGFQTMRNAILIVSSGTKSVSSSAGHELMDTHPYAANRYAQASQRMSQLIPVLQQGDWATFGQIAENEALTLHALMMASNPSYLLMKPASLELIEKIRSFRADTGLSVYFSLDAGPNLHVLYPDHEAEKVEEFLLAECVPVCEAGNWIPDRCGAGPEEIIG
ncbi:MAG: diphosphomevalonate decarboxylase [Saprospiraceae bacterium]|nr:diphosphomevalonate decarboxylase [Saprospiraceae bacterium]